MKIKVERPPGLQNKMCIYVYLYQILTTTHSLLTSRNGLLWDSPKLPTSILQKDTAHGPRTTDDWPLVTVYGSSSN